MWQQLLLRRWLGEDIHVETGGGALDGNGTDGAGVELGGANTTDEGVDMAEVVEMLEGEDEESLADARGAQLGIDTHGAEETAGGDIAAGEAENLLVAGGDEAGDGLAGEGDLALADPFGAEVLADPGGDEVALVRAGVAENDTLGGEACLEGGEIGEVVETDEHVEHSVCGGGLGGK